MSLSVHVHNKKDILILGKGLTQWLDDTALTTEAKYSINFPKQGKKFRLSLYFNGSNSYLFVNRLKSTQFKAKDSELNEYSVCLGDFSKVLQLRI